MMAAAAANLFLAYGLFMGCMMGVAGRPSAALAIGNPISGFAAVGDVVIGHHTRIGLHNTIIGPVTVGNHVNLAQGITVTALNHNFADASLRIDEQGVSTLPVTIEDDVCAFRSVISALGSIARNEARIAVRSASSPALLNP